MYYLRDFYQFLLINFNPWTAIELLQIVTDLTRSIQILTDSFRSLPILTRFLNNLEILIIGVATDFNVYCVRVIAKHDIHSNYAIVQD